MTSSITSNLNSDGLQPPVLAMASNLINSDGLPKVHILHYRYLILFCCELIMVLILSSGDGDVPMTPVVDEVPGPTKLRWST